MSCLTKARPSGGYDAENGQPKRQSAFLLPVPHLQSVNIFKRQIPARRLKLRLRGFEVRDKDRPDTDGLTPY